MTVRTSVLWKMNIHMAKKMARKGLTKVIYKGTFVSKQSLLDTGHISIYGAIQSLKHGSMQNEDFDTTTDHFNAV